MLGALSFFVDSLNTSEAVACGALQARRPACQAAPGVGGAGCKGGRAPTGRCMHCPCGLRATPGLALSQPARANQSPWLRRARQARRATRKLPLQRRGAQLLGRAWPPPQASDPVAAVLAPALAVLLPCRGGACAVRAAPARASGA